MEGFLQISTVIRERDFIVFITQDDISHQDQLKMKDLCAEISQSTDAIIAIFPERVYRNMEKLSLVELIELREILDNAIQNLVERDGLEE